METLTIKTIGPWMLHGEQILISGNCPLLGGWDPAKALPMKVTQGIIWSIDLDKSRIPETFEYKFIRTRSPRPPSPTSTRATPAPPSPSSH